MNETEIRDLLYRFGDAWNEHDLTGALTMCTDEVVFESTGPGPDGERAVGKHEVHAAWTPIFDNPKSHFDTEEMMIGDDFAVTLWRYTWGDGHIRGCDVFHFRDGLVASKRSYVKG